MRELELRRHAAREKDQDGLSVHGRAQAEEVGRTLAGDYSAMFVSPAREELLDRVPDQGRALAVGHSPLIEAAVYSLTGSIIEPLAECEGVLLVRVEGGYRMRELRLPPAVQAPS